MTTKKRENANDWKVIISFDGETRTTFAKHELLLRVKFSEAVKRHWQESALMRFDEAERLDASTWYGKTYTSSGKLLEYKVIWRVDLIKQAATRLGALGGAAGRGKAKRRGDSEYYKRLRARQNKRKIQ
tara:strand:+ start:14744 stop:15130 length:387 start_codon:yes stop_codon:yes gene_type:complete